jgi:hypothetical protein
MDLRYRRKQIQAGGGMRGIVAQVNDGNLAAVSLMAGYTVIEITDQHSVSEGDIVNGDLETVGHIRTLRNETTGKDIEVAIADYCHSLAQARKLMFKAE